MHDSGILYSSLRTSDSSLAGVLTVCSLSAAGSAFADLSSHSLTTPSSQTSVPGLQRESISVTCIFVLGH